MTDLDKLEAALVLAMDYARDAAASGEAYAAGRYDGLKQALEVLDDVRRGRLT